MTAAVWWMHVDGIDASLGDQWSRLLLPQENERADRFLQQEDRISFLGAHALLRAMLLAIAGLPAATCRFRTGAYGKPELHPDCNILNLDFNISHTKGAVACGMTFGSPIGVDIENRCRLADPLEIAAACFAPLERDAIRDAPKSDHVRLFYRYWTLKEAVLKALGFGLSIPLPDVFIDLEAVTVKLPNNLGANGFRLAVEEVSDCLTLGTALQGDPPPRSRRIEADAVVGLATAFGNGL